jgi:hypothetical protein
VQNHRLEKEAALQPTDWIATPEARIAVLRERSEKGHVADNMTRRRKRNFWVMQRSSGSIHDVEMHSENHQPPIWILRAVRLRSWPKDEARTGAQLPGPAVKPHHADSIHDVPQ